MVIDTLEASTLAAVELFKTASFPIAFTGAGISTPSGIPDFRSKDTGLWEKYDPFSVASYNAWKTNPRRFFDWLIPLILTSLEAQPNAAHFALAKLEQNADLKAVITQNIDGLHQRSGSKNIIELHGSCTKFNCLQCGEELGVNEIKPRLEKNEIPVCKNCGQVLKPDIVLFEELLPRDAFSLGEEYCMTSDLILVIGSSLNVMPAASLPLTAVKNGAKMIINNYTATPYDSFADVIVRDNVTDFLTHLVGVIL